MMRAERIRTHMPKRKMGQGPREIHKIDGIVNIHFYLFDMLLFYVIYTFLILMLPILTLWCERFMFSFNCDVFFQL